MNYYEQCTYIGAKTRRNSCRLIIQQCRRGVDSGEGQFLGDDRKDGGGQVLERTRKSGGGQVSKIDKEKKIHFGFKVCPYILGELDNILFC